MANLSQGQKRRLRRNALEKARANEVRTELALSRAAAREVGAKVNAVIDPKTGKIMDTTISPSYRDGAAQFETAAVIYGGHRVNGGYEDRDSLPTHRRGRKVVEGVDYLAWPRPDGREGYRIHWFFGNKAPNARVLTNVRTTW